jgi:hypothetical protein
MRKANKTRAKVVERQAQITILQDKIAHVKARFEADCEEAAAKLRPTMDALHNRILSIQQQMASLWSRYSLNQQQAECDVHAVVEDFEAQIRILEHENRNGASFLAPIRRLPMEMLSEIFCLAIYCNNQSPLELARVCQFWRAGVLSMRRVWSNFRLSTWTKPEKIDFILERTAGMLLDVEIDTGADVLKIVDDKEVRYAGVGRAVSVAGHWRNLIITSFPPKVDIDAYWASVKPAFTFDGPVNALASLRIKNPCEDSTAFAQLLDVVGSGSHEKLDDMELSSPNAIYHFAQPEFASIFRRLITFKVNVREMRTEVDILAQFERLETLEAYRLRLPTYPIESDLPLVRTLKQLTIKTVSVQWMAGRTFPNLVEATIIWPHYPETLTPGGGVNLPVCTHFTYDDHIIDVLPNFRIPKLDTLIVRNEAWNKPRGSRQLAAVWKGTSGHVCPLKPRVLHLDTQCHDQHLINALMMHPDLEELYLGVVRPDGLGKKFFGALQAKKGRSSCLTSVTHICMVCPNLKVFGIRYRHWIRGDEADEVTPLLQKIIESRQTADTPLESCMFWPTKDIPDNLAVDLCRSSQNVHCGGESTVQLPGMEGVLPQDLILQRTHIGA